MGEDEDKMTSLCGDAAGHSVFMDNPDVAGPQTKFLGAWSRRMVLDYKSLREVVRRTIASAKPSHERKSTGTIP